MLVLSRKKCESIMIGDDIQICVVEIRGDKVRLGIEAPQEIPVHRLEVYEAIQRENNRRLEKDMQKIESLAIEIYNRENREKIDCLTSLSEAQRATFVKRAASKLGILF